MRHRCKQCGTGSLARGEPLCFGCRNSATYFAEKAHVEALAVLHAACRTLVKYDDDAEPIAEDDGRPYGLHSAQVNEDFAALFKAMLDATRKMDELTT